MPAILFTRDFLDQAGVAHFSPGCCFRFFAGSSPIHLVLRRHSQVAFKFVVEFAITFIGHGFAFLIPVGSAA